MAKSTHRTCWGEGCPRGGRGGNHRRGIGDFARFRETVSAFAATTGCSPARIARKSRPGAAFRTRLHSRVASGALQ
jgi:hypothetical protein